MTRVAGVLLAAGRSSRMGARNKLLMPIDGVPMVRRVADALKGGGLDEIVVVLGHEAAEVQAVLPPRLRSVVNPAFTEGMGSSLARGVNALLDDADGILVALGDMPWLGPKTVRDLTDAFRVRSPGVSIVAPRFEGRRGHPVIFGAVHRPALLACRGDEGARALVQRQSDAIAWVESEDDGVLLDLDRPFES